MADGRVEFDIVGNDKGINQTVKDVTRNIESESKKWDKAAGQATDNIEGSFSKMTGKVVGMLAAAGIASTLLSWGSAAVEAASDLREVQNVVDTVFGDGANQIEAWAKKAGSQFGLTETQAKKFTSTLGAMMKSSGLAGNEIIGMSTDLAGLAADMASFYNLDFETAFEKIRSGISGETMPLKQLGINMSVANLEAFALAQGLKKTFSEMDQGEQTMLRYQYLMQATADAQGDFEKTADGYANAQRRIASAIESIKTTAGTFLLDTIQPMVSGVADFLEKITTTPDRTIIDDFNEIDVDTAGKMADLEATYEKAQSIIKLIDEISKQTVTLSDGSTKTFEELFKDIGNIEANGGDVRGYLESLGLDVDYVIQKYNVWKESTRQLTSLVPSLTGVINSETGAIEGGTEALQKNLDEWKYTQEKKLAWTAYYAKARALEEKKAELYSYEFDEGTARQALKRQADKMRELFGAEFDENGIITVETSARMSSQAEYGSDWYNALTDYNKLLSEWAKKRDEYNRQADAFVDKEQELADGKAALIEKWGEEEEAIEDAIEALDEYGELSEETWDEFKKNAEGAKDAIKALTDYYQGVKDSTEQAVNSTIKGFEKIGKAGDDLRKKSSDLAGEETEALNKYTDIWNKWGSNNDALKQMAASWDSLTDKEQEAYNALAKIRNEQKEVNDALNQYKPEGMKASLQSQIDFMEEYLANLEKAQNYGLSDEFLASLSDGSKESAEFLKGLVEGGPEAASAVDELYQEVQSKKKSFVDTLTEQKIAADETFQGLVDKALEVVGELNLYDEAEQSLADTVSGIADGIGEKIPAVKSAVDSLLDQLNRLSGFGFSFGFGGGGDITFYNGPAIEGEFETGLSWVPHDGFLASLHEGEGILTAEENRIWQRFKNGQVANANVDYDALGGVMRDNVKAGGDVYLDRRIVGRVISDVQGESYRNLTRSGWQG